MSVEEGPDGNEGVCSKPEQQRCEEKFQSEKHYTHENESYKNRWPYSYLKCCGSFRHLVANCPDALGNKANVNVTEDEHAVLFTGYNKDGIARLGVDARNCAVLDSACSSTVCGKLWHDGYLKSLDKADQNKVYQTEGVKFFKFGGGTRLKSEGEYSIPAVIAGRKASNN